MTNPMTFFEPMIRHIAAVQGFGVDESAIRAAWHYCGEIVTPTKEADMLETELKEAKQARDTARAGNDKKVWLEACEAVNVLNRRIVAISSALESIGWRWMPTAGGFSFDEGDDSNKGQWVKFNKRGKQIAIEGDKSWRFDFKLAGSGLIGTSRSGRIIAALHRYINGGRHGNA